MICFQFAGWDAINFGNIIPFFLLVYFTIIGVKLSLYFWLVSCSLTLVLSFSYLNYFGYNAFFDFILIYEFLFVAIHLVAVLYLLFDKEAKYFFNECKNIDKLTSKKKNKA